ncbi:MAG: ShlB/FhaC/HecB family hemolysin secretion/activation protein [Nitrospirae bacterium]|nr:ShlB/FhaC/HecB family hemolysin secretion/activation protein [Magnetococcales bacterium]
MNLHRFLKLYLFIHVFACYFTMIGTLAADDGQQGGNKVDSPKTESSGQQSDYQEIANNEKISFELSAIQIIGHTLKTQQDPLLKHDRIREIVAEALDFNTNTEVKIAKGCRLKFIDKQQTDAQAGDNLCIQIDPSRMTNLAAVNRAAVALTRALRQDGLFLSHAFIPSRVNHEDVEIDQGNGVVPIQIISGVIKGVTVKDDEKSKSATSERIKERIRIIFKTIVNRSPLRQDDFQRAVLLADALPGIELQAHLRPYIPSSDSKSSTTGLIKGMEEGAANLVVYVTYAPMNAGLKMDNYGSRYIGPQQEAVSAKFNQPFGLGEQFSLLAQGGGLFQDSIMGKAELLLPLALNVPVLEKLDGLNLIMDASLQRSDPGYTLKTLELATDRWQGGIALEYPWWLVHGKELRMKASMRHSSGETDLLGLRFQEEELTTFSPGITFDMSIQQNQTAGRFLIESYSTHGLDWGNTTVKDSRYSARPEADPVFDKFNVDAHFRASQLWPKWFGNRLKPFLLTEFSGQYTQDPLFPQEEFAIGGGNLGRGYAPGEIVGDRGIAGKIETGLEYMGTTDAHTHTYLFSDAGSIWNLDDSYRNTREEHQSLASVGVGIRQYFTPSQDWSEIKVIANVELAKPINRNPNTEDDRNPSIHFRFDLNYF